MLFFLMIKYILTYSVGECSDLVTSGDKSNSNYLVYEAALGLISEKLSSKCYVSN